MCLVILQHLAISDDHQGPAAFVTSHEAACMCHLWLLRHSPSGSDSYMLQCSAAAQKCGASDPTEGRQLHGVICSNAGLQQDVTSFCCACQATHSVHAWLFAQTGALFFCTSGLLLELFPDLADLWPHVQQGWLTTTHRQLVMHPPVMHANPCMVDGTNGCSAGPHK